MQKIAVLIVYENFSCPPEGLQRFIADFSNRGALVVKRAYTDWVRFSGFRQLLLANQVELIELPCASKGKNIADIRLVVDAMELVFTKPYINTYLIASADADFFTPAKSIAGIQQTVDRRRQFPRRSRLHADPL